MCRVGISKPLMTYYGNRLYEMLSATFPNTFFHFSIFIIEDECYPFEEFDLSILLISEISLKNYANIPAGYTSRWIRSYPISIWVSSLSPWSERCV